MHFTVCCFQMRKKIMNISIGTTFSFNSPKPVQSSNNISINCNECLHSNSKQFQRKKLEFDIQQYVTGMPSTENSHLLGF